MESTASLNVVADLERTHLRVRPVTWPPAGMTVEVMRLLIQDEHERWLTLLGLDLEDLAAWRYFDFGASGGACWLADDGRRLVGFVTLVPAGISGCGASPREVLASPLIVSSRAPEGTFGALLHSACADRLTDGAELIVPVPTADIRALDALLDWGFKPAGGVASAVARSRADLNPSGFEHRLARLRLRYFGCRASFEPDSAAPPGSPSICAGELHAIGLGAARRGFAHADLLAVEQPGGELLGLVGYHRVANLYAVAGYSLARIDAIAIDKDWVERGLIRWLAIRLRMHLARRGIDGILIEVNVDDELAARLLREFEEADFRVSALHQVLRFGPTPRPVAGRIHNPAPGPGAVTAGSFAESQP